MVLDILYFSKGRDLEYEHVKALELAAEVWNLVTHRAEGLGVGLDRDFELSSGVLEADNAALRTVLVNILENALDACRVDGKKETHHVAFRVRAGPDDTVEFEIEDDGIGMDRETREMMFSLFFSSKGKEGTGLGMFVSKQIVRQHGGTIEAVSDPDEGTRIVVRMPRTRNVVDAT